MEYIYFLYTISEKSVSKMNFEYLVFIDNQKHFKRICRLLIIILFYSSIFFICSVNPTVQVVHDQSCCKQHRARGYRFGSKRQSTRQRLLLEGRNMQQDSEKAKKSFHREVPCVGRLDQ